MRHLLPLASLACFVVGCAQIHRGDDHDTPPPGGGSGGADLGPPRCGGERLMADLVVPSLQIALDRSCSMVQKVGATSKWKLAVDALDKLTTAWAGKLRFGLSLFPDTSAPACDESSLPIPIGAGNEGAIRSLLMASLSPSDPNYPSAGPCVTPIDAGMHRASLDPGLADPAHPGYALLITDGAQYGCSTYGGAAGAVKVATALASSGVHTFVIGFGGAVDANELDALANAGGEPSGGAHAFYDAANGQALDAALQAIAGKAFSCVYQLASAPPDPTLVYVFFDQVEVARDATHGSGWDYDGATNQVRFYGSACQQLGSGSVQTLDIVFGCEAPPIQ